MAPVFDPPERLRFAKCVRHRSLDGNANTAHVRFPKRVKLVGKFPIAIPNEKARSDALFVHPHCGIACLLHHPVGIGMIRARTGKNFSASHMNKHEDIGIAYPAERPDRLCKKIARHDGVHMRVDKRRPRHRRFLFRLVRRRIMARFLEDIVLPQLEME